MDEYILFFPYEVEDKIKKVWGDVRKEHDNLYNKINEEDSKLLIYIINNLADKGAIERVYSPVLLTKKEWPKIDILWK